MVKIKRRNENRQCVESNSKKQPNCEDSAEV